MPTLNQAYQLAIALLLLLSLNAAAATWDFSTPDILGRPIGPAFFSGHVTVATFSTHDQDNKLVEVGQKIGAKYGARPGYQTLVVVNTVQLNFFLKPFASSSIKDKYEESVADAVKRQQAAGRKHANAENVRKVVAFVHDEEGKIWQKLGVAAQPAKPRIGVFDQKGALVLLEALPLNWEKFDTAMQAGFKTVVPAKK